MKSSDTTRVYTLPVVRSTGVVLLNLERICVLVSGKNNEATLRPPSRGAVSLP
jgi:hypothetical protein